MSWASWIYGHLSRDDVYFQAQAGYSKNTWSGREDCFQGNNYAAVAASATGGGADPCGFLSPAARITGFCGAPCNPSLLGPGFPRMPGRMGVF